MNGNTSTAGCKNPERLPDAAELERQWKTIDWKKAEAVVSRLQARIAKATQEKKWNTVKRLQYLLTHSYYAKVLAVRKVTTNKGKNTPGIDKELWNTPASKMRGALLLTDKGYKAKPLRRVYIEKPGKKAKRPLGIPCMHDRAMQALYALALDPVSETTADTKSYGFRKGRCAQDACEHIFKALSRTDSPQWILEGDIKGCFDHISHDWLIEHIPMDKSVLKPSKKSVKALNANLHETVLGRGKAWRQEDLIRKLNQQLRGWANYHQSVCAKDAFSRADHILYEMLWRWAKRRHPKKNRRWITANYWHHKELKNWVFTTGKEELMRLGEVPIVRHTKVRMDANPYLDTEYFTRRKFQNGMKRLSGRYKKIWRNQHGCCYHCGLPMEISDEREIFYKVPLSMGGKDEVHNMAYVHKYCQSIFLERRAKA